MAVMGLSRIGLAADAAGPLITMSAAEWEKMDTFENHTLVNADKTFIKGQWRQAAAEYDAFILEFPRSKAIPYVLVRKGRCRQAVGKLFKAVEEYN